MDGDDSAADSEGTAVGDGSADGPPPTPPGAGGPRSWVPMTRATTTAAARDAEPEDLVHGWCPPRRPPRGAALWGRFHLVQHRPRDAGDVLVPVLVEPRPDSAGDVPVGGVEIVHCATSRVVGCASAFSAKRNCPVA